MSRSDRVRARTTRALVVATLVAAAFAPARPLGAQQPMTKREAAAAARRADIVNVLGSKALRRGIGTNGRLIEVVVGSDSSISIPESTTEGTLFVRLTERNKVDRGRHAVFVSRVPLGTPLEDVQREVGKGGLQSLGLASLGGPGRPDTSGRNTTLVQFRPGNYVVSVADIAPNGKKSFSPKGVAILRVIGVTKVNAPEEPITSAVIRLDDSKISISRPLPATATTLRVENHGFSAHGLVIRRLGEGKTAADVRRWLETQKGEAPFTHVASTTPMSADRAIYMYPSFTSGTYLFSLDATGGATSLDGATIVTVK